MSDYENSKSEVRYRQLTTRRAYYEMSNLSTLEQARRIATHYLRHATVAEQLLRITELARAGVPIPQEASHVVGYMMDTIQKHHAYELGIELEWEKDESLPHHSFPPLPPVKPAAKADVVVQRLLGNSPRNFYWKVYVGGEPLHEEHDQEDWADEQAHRLRTRLAEGTLPAFGLFRPDGSLFDVFLITALAEGQEDFILARSWKELQPEDDHRAGIPHPLAEDTAKAAGWKVLPITIKPNV